MSLALADSGSTGPAAPSRGALAVILVLALALHLALVALVFWASPRDGTVAEGQGGLTVGLGPAGAAPDALDAVQADSVDAVTPDTLPLVEATADAPPTASPAPAPEVSASPTAAAAPAALTPQPAPTSVETHAPQAVSRLAPQPESARTPTIAESVAPVAAQSVPVETATSPDEALVVPDIPVPEAQPDVDPGIVTAAELDPATKAQPDLSPDTVTPEATIADTITATAPQDGLGVSRRPVKRPSAVEDAARKIAEAEAAAGKKRQQRRAAETRSAPANPSPSRETASGQQGQSGTSKGSTRGSGDDTRGGGNPGARADFAALVAARLARAKQYPRAAQQRRLQGTGVVWFRINVAGTVTASRLTRSTGHPILDQEIMQTLRRARLPSIPAILNQTQLEFSVPMAFNLR